jgi:predicted metal-dependent enzyme (double-stranded beta helix superfamily)
VSGFAPPGDIHRVRNTGDTVAVSMHVYGADISRLGNSIRREYDLARERAQERATGRPHKQSRTLPLAIGPTSIYR